MLRSKTARFFAVALGSIILCAVATEARAQLQPPLTAPLSCTLTLAGAPLTIQAGADLLPFPHDVPCPGATGTTCSEFTYRFTYAGGNISQSFLSVSSDLAIFEASPSGAIEATSCIGDSTTKVGLNVCEQRQVRFNEAASTVNAKVVVTRAAPRVSTAGARKGNSEAYCLIQGPGVPGDGFKPFTTSAQQTVAGGKVNVIINFDALGNPSGGTCAPVQPPGSQCFEGSPVGDLLVNGEVLRDFTTVTFGDNTSTCIKGNPTRCFCTAAPCP